MKQAALAGMIALAAAGAQASTTVNGVTGAAGQLQSATTFLLTSSNVSGGQLLTTSVANIAQMPSGTVGNYVAGEPASAGGSATVTLTPGMTSVGFEWGTPDTYNTLLVTLANGQTASFCAYGCTSGNLGLGGADTYVNFSAGSAIASLTFEATASAFEAANFGVSAVPEPTNVALLLAGLGMFGMMARRRRV